VEMKLPAFTEHIQSKEEIATLTTIQL